MQLFSTNSKVLVSCKEAGPCEGHRRRGAKEQFQDLNDTHCCPLSFCIDHRCRWQRAANSTKIVAVCCCSDDSGQHPMGHTCADAIGISPVRQAGWFRRQCRRACARMVDLALNQPESAARYSVRYADPGAGGGGCTATQNAQGLGTSAIDMSAL